MAPKAVLLMQLLLPLSVASALLYRPHLRSHIALWVTIGIGIAVLIEEALSIYKRTSSQRSPEGPWHALLQVGLCTALYCSLSLAAGDHNVILLLMICTPYVTIAIMGNRAMMAIAWAMMVIGIAMSVGLQLAAVNAVWTTLGFAITFGTIGLAEDVAVNAASISLDQNRAMAHVASAAGSLRTWPDDLSPLGPHLATAMSVTRFMVTDRSDPSDPFSPILCWPDEKWITNSTLASLSMRAAHKGSASRDDGFLAVSGPSGADGVVVIVEEREGDAKADEAAAATCVALLSTMKDRARLVNGLLDLAHRDTLTGLANRRHGYEGLQSEMLAASRNHLPLSVALIDLDHFKTYNDTYGQAAGDAALQNFARRLRSRLRGRDLIVRYGGEEFLLVLVDTETDGAITVLEDLRDEDSGQAPGARRITFSAGVATWDGQETIDELIIQADTRLRGAKEAGRDQIVETG